MSRYRTPLRYPGGKQRLTPFVLEVLECNDLIGGNYVEPYAGGAGVAIELLLDNHVKKIHLNDSSVPIYAFWKSIKNHPELFCRRISSAALTVEEWRKHQMVVRNPAEYDEIDVGFSTFYLNRCNRSGVLSGGLIGGLKQNGEWNMDARFPRNELIRRVEAIADRAKSISISNLDAEKFILSYIPKLPENTLVYCDPPYFEKAGRLYLNVYGKNDHERISRVIQKDLARKWLVSYDGAPEILEFYVKRRSFLYDLQYSAARAYKGKEVFVFSDDLKVPAESTLPYIDIALQRHVDVLSRIVSKRRTSSTTRATAR